MIKNVLFSDVENDVLNGLNADNYYVFEGKYGNDTVKTKGDKNTLQFDGGTEYYFTAQGNNLVMHTETNATEFDKKFYYNGVFTNEEYRAENNKSVSELYIDNGEISETGTDDQRIGDKYLLKFEEDKFSCDLYVSGDGYVYNYDDGYREKLDPSTPLYVDPNGDVRTDKYNNIPENAKFYLEDYGSEGQYRLTTNATDYYGQSNTEIELFEKVSKYTAQAGDMYYNPVTKEFTTEAMHNLLPEGAKLLSECYLPGDSGYFTTQQENDYDELIGDRKVYIQSEPKFNENYNYPNSYDYFHMSFSGHVEDGDYEIDPTKTYIFFSQYEDNGSTYQTCCFIDAKTAIGDNIKVEDLTENLVSEKYWLNNALINISTHPERNIPISELYLVDGEIKESGTPEQLIGDKTLYEFNGKYYTDARNTGDGTVTINNFLKGKIDVNVDIGDSSGNLADMVKNSYILYDKSDATKKQTIKAHTNWNDKVIGSDFNDKIYGGNYNDKLYGGAGNDVIYTRTGDDEVYGEDGNDKIYLNGKGTKVVDAGSGDDRIYLTAKNISANITAGEDNDRIYIKKSVLENSVLNFKEGSGNDIVAVSKKVDVSNLRLNIENFNADTSKFSKSGNNLKITSGNDSVTLTNYFVKGYKVSSAQLQDKTLAEWVENSELYITSNSKTTKGTVYDDVITVGPKVKSVSSYAGDDVICSNYQKITINGGDGDDTFNFMADYIKDYTILFDVKKDSNEVGNALYVVSNDSKKLSNGVTLKNVENVTVNDESDNYELTSEVIESVQNWLNSANKGNGYDSVADAISHKCNVQELIAAFNPQATPQEQIV